VFITIEISSGVEPVIAFKRLGKRTLAVRCRNRRLFRVPFFPDAGVDEYLVFARVDEDAVSSLTECGFLRLVELRVPKGSGGTTPNIAPPVEPKTRCRERPQACSPDIHKKNGTGNLNFPFLILPVKSRVTYLLFWCLLIVFFVRGAPGPSVRAAALQFVKTLALALLLHRFLDLLIRDLGNIEILRNGDVIFSRSTL
jgi:hypothetical protein